MTEWMVGRIILFLAFFVGIAGAHYRSLAEQHAKPGQHRVDRNFGPSRLEFYTPQGRFYLRLGRWLMLAALGLGAAWVYLSVIR